MKFYKIIKKPIAIFIMGTTASGKTKIAIKLKKQLNCELISVDSAMVYRRMDIGTDKPNKIFHALIDIRKPHKQYSVWDFRQDAIYVMKQISKLGKIPILVGGTMFYFKMLLEGIAVIPFLQYKIKTYNKYYYLLLTKLSKKNKIKIYNNDIYRIQRFLEVYLNTDKIISFYWKNKKKEKFPWKVIKIIVAHKKKENLYKNMLKRLNIMLKKGLITEVERLKTMQNMFIDLPAIRSIGYRQVCKFINGQYNFFILKEKILAANRKLAKKQKLWLRKYKDATCLDTYDHKLCDKILYLLKTNITDDWKKNI